jgi:hypothetical protein
MKNLTTAICTFTIIVFTLNSCQKVYLPPPITGVYFSQQNNSPYGHAIELFADNTVAIDAGNQHFHETYSYDGNTTIHFGNGNIATIYNNTLTFTNEVEYLNPEYYDGNNDGYDDWDYTTPHYIWETHTFNYYR